MLIIDCECHLMPLAEDVNFYPLYQRNQQALRNLVKRHWQTSYMGVEKIGSLKEYRDIVSRRPGLNPSESADALVEKMDEAGVNISCVLPESFLPMVKGARMMSTNGWLANEIGKYPDRLIGVCNVGPISWRGVKNAIWELEYFVKEKNFKAVKLYPVDDMPVNNKELWPYYEKIQELGVPLFIHTGFSWCIPGRSSNCAPWLLEDVCEDFPEMTILAYHMGYPFTDALNICAAKYPNLYIGTSLLPAFGHGLSKRSQILMGEAIQWAGIDKIIWGTDIGANRLEVAFLKKFQIDEEIHSEYGYQPLSEEDREKWAGLNLARILKITPNN